jgi:DHA2 family multidrug resistance protein
MPQTRAGAFRGGAGRLVPSMHHEHPSYRWWVLANVMIGTFMAVMDATIVNVALAKIMGVFGITIDKVEWVMTAYLLVFAVMLPTSGWVADHFGYKKTYILALGLFTAGSFLCSMSWNESALIFFRVVQGAGAGFLMPVGMAIVTREFPPEQRGAALGFWAVAAAASVSLGPMIGGYLVTNFAWHTIFDVNIPVGILGIIATAIIQREYKAERARSFDVVGFISVTVFLTFLLLALTNGNSSWNTGGWTSTYILTCFGLATIGLVVFLVTEFSVKHPLIALDLFESYNFSLSNLILFIFGLGMFGSTFLLPLYLQNALDYTPFQAGLVFLPVGIIQGVLSPISGVVSDKISPKVPAVLGVIALSVSFFLNYNLSAFSDLRQIMIPLYLRGIGLGLLFTPLSTVALSDIPRYRMAQASGMFNVIRQVGGSFGVAIFGTLLTRRMIFHSAVYGASVDAYSPAFKKAITNLAYFAQHVGGGTAADAAARAHALAGSYISRQAFVSAINDDFFIAGVITIACLIVILFLKGRRSKAPGPGGPLE